MKILLLIAALNTQPDLNTILWCGGFFQSQMDMITGNIIPRQQELAERFYIFAEKLYGIDAIGNKQHDKFQEGIDYHKKLVKFDNAEIITRHLIQCEELLNLKDNI